MKCSICGKTNPKTNNFCSKCGNVLVLEIDKNDPWECIYCDKEFKTKKEADKHELTCKKNQNKINKNADYKTFLITAVLFLLLIISIYFIYFYPNFINNKSKASNWSLVIPVNNITPTVTAKKNNSNITDNKKESNTVLSDSDPWGVAKQVDEHTWTMKVGMDKVMAKSEEILSAINEYRRRNGSQPLTIDSKLNSYAQSRADYLFSIKRVDGHKGFNDFLDKEDGFNKLGFTWLGENASFGFQLNGVHLIEWMYAGDEPHNKNQLDNKWSHVGIGVKGTATSLIFGTGKM